MQGEGQHGFIARKGQVGDWLTGVSCQRPRCHQVCHRTVHVASVLCGYAWRQRSSSTMQLYPTQTFWARHLCTVNVCLCWIQLCLCWIQLHGRGRWLGLTYKVNSLWLYLYLHVQQQSWIKSKNMIKHWNQTLSTLSGCIEQELQNDNDILVGALLWPHSKRGVWLFFIPPEMSLKWISVCTNLVRSSMCKVRHLSHATIELTLFTICNQLSFSFVPTFH